MLLPASLLAEEYGWPTGCRSSCCCLALLWGSIPSHSAATTPCRDTEFYDLFDNQQAAINYVTMLVGCEWPEAGFVVQQCRQAV